MVFHLLICIDQPQDGGKKIFKIFTGFLAGFSQSQCVNYLTRVGQEQLCVLPYLGCALPHVMFHKSKRNLIKKGSLFCHFQQQILRQKMNEVSRAIGQTARAYSKPESGLGGNTNSYSLTWQHLMCYATSKNPFCFIKRPFSGFNQKPKCAARFFNDIAKTKQQYLVMAKGHASEAPNVHGFSN